MKLVAIESPYASDIKKNTEYARRCLEDSINRGEAPIASHLLYPQVLDEGDQAERELGIELGLEWTRKADLVVFYVDLGWSRGMEAAFRRLSKTQLDNLGRPLPMPEFDIRRIDEDAEKS